MRTFVKLILLFGLIAYLIFALSQFANYGDQTPCKQVIFTIADSSRAAFITAAEADHILQKSGEYPIGKPMEQVDGQKIEAALLKNAFVDSVSCYKSPNGVVNILLMQRLPLMRIMAANGDDYYIDEKGNIMNPQGYVADLVVATGDITKEYSRKELTKMGRFLHSNDFWNNQIEQINVTPRRHLQLVTRVGAHTIEFGTTDQLERKFRNLRTFYEKVLPEVGWNKYSEISVEHVAQIVGTRNNNK